MARLQQFGHVPPVDPEAITSQVFTRAVEDALLDAAKTGADYTELRLPHQAIYQPDFVQLFFDALQVVQETYPQFEAAPILSVWLWAEDADEVREAFPAAAEAGLAGVEIVYVPYAEEADWNRGSVFVKDAAAAGLGVTIPVGAFSKANIGSVVEMPEVSRIGHAVYADDDPGLLRAMAERGITVEVCLSSALAQGMVPDLAQHPLPKFLDAGVSVALGTDSPLRLGTSIDIELALLRRLGLSQGQLAHIERMSSDARFASLN
ncbi:hypothetical protein [Natronoglycomyces albus]|uniref:Adenosine deaminase domain-containing protein n=1 Tax=Natronoglycomyces albus TaxID=2811108 RepID=A0A895XXP4_9ACTN|nr:hypothetical protein [Natronoglycomyces albus]QSB06398.1 hypothetical protein JQS30_05685 [Natronoglycomyces albus]